MLKKIQTQIQERVDAEIAAVVPVLEWELIKAIVYIERSIETPCFKIIFTPGNAIPPAKDATAALKKKWDKYKVAQEMAQSLVHGMIFTLTNFAKDTFQLTNNDGAGLIFEKIDAITGIGYGGFAVTLKANKLTKEVYDELSQ